MRRALSMSLRQAQQALQLPPIEPDDDFAVDDGHGGGPVPELLKLSQRRGVLPDVLVGEADAFLRKKLFLRLATRSARLAIHDDFFCHQALPCAPPFRVLSPYMREDTKITATWGYSTPRRACQLPLLTFDPAAWLRTRPG